MQQCLKLVVFILRSALLAKLNEGEEVKGSFMIHLTVILLYVAVKEATPSKAKAPPVVRTTSRIVEDSEFISLPADKEGEGPAEATPHNEATPMETVPPGVTPLVIVPNPASPDDTDMATVSSGASPLEIVPLEQTNVVSMATVSSGAIPLEIVTTSSAEETMTSDVTTVQETTPPDVVPVQETTPSDNDTCRTDESKEEVEDDPFIIAGKRSQEIDAKIGDVEKTYGVLNLEKCLGLLAAILPHELSVSDLQYITLPWEWVWNRGCGIIIILFH